MGQKTSKENEFGKVTVVLDKSKYTAGDQVNGFIHLYLTKSFPSNILYLYLTGKEKVKIPTTKGFSNENQNVEVVVHKDKNEFFSHYFLS